MRITLLFQISFKRYYIDDFVAVVTVFMNILHKLSMAYNNSLLPDTDAKVM